MLKDKIEIRELASVKELNGCVALQREVFNLPELEVSPVRHLVVTKHAGGFTLGAFAGEQLVGFVLSVPAFGAGERYFYSHIAGVLPEFQSFGIGACLKWAQREKSLRENVKFIKWTFQPVQARNAFFNLEKLGAVIREYKPNYYGTDYSTADVKRKKIGLDSDRLFAEWNLESEKVEKLAKGEKFAEIGEVAQTIETLNNWNELVETNPNKAIAEQEKIKREFQKAFAENLVCRRFERSANHPVYLLYKD